MQTQTGVNNKNIRMYDQYKAHFCSSSLTIGLAYLYGIAYSNGYFGAVLFTLQEVWDDALSYALRDPWFYASFLPILFFIVPWIKRGGYHRLDTFNPTTAIKQALLVTMGIIVVAGVIYVSLSHLFSLYVFIGVISITYVFLFTMFQRVFTVESTSNEIDQMTIEDM